MNVIICLNQQLARKVAVLCKTLNRSRNSIITEALELYIKQQPKPWPEHFFDFDPIPDVPDFKALSRNQKTHSVAISEGFSNFSP